MEERKSFNMNEFAIEWVKGRDYAGVTVPSGTAWKSKLMNLGETGNNKEQ